MKHFLLFILLFSRVLTFGQNYQVFNDTERGYYSYRIGDFLYAYNWLHKDVYFSASSDSSVLQGNQTIIYHPNVIRGTNISDTGCTMVRDSSLFGNQTILKNNGDYLFLTLNSDTLLLKSQENIGATWQLGTLNNQTLKVEAAVQSIQPSPIFNITDNIKTINLTVKDTQGNVVPHFLNHQPIQLSENYGIVECPNILYFGSDTTRLTLVGHSALNGDFKEIKWSDIYNFEVGDIFHTLNRYRPAPTYENNTYKSRIVAGKQMSGDSVSYQMTVLEVTIIEDNGIFDTTALNYNDTETYPLFHPSDTVLPQTSYIFGNATNSLGLGDYNLYHYRYTFNNIDNEYMNGRMVKTAVNDYIIYNRQDTCVPAFIGSPADEYEYIEGCGGPYELNWGPSSYQLKYFKKGVETWGTPYDFDLLSSTNEVKLATSLLQIMPNPATHQVRFSIKNEMQNSHLRIFDITGKVVYEELLGNEGSVDLSVANWSNGIYWVRIVGEERVWTGKLVKQ